jgi:hypothetical protein
VLVKPVQGFLLQVGQGKELPQPVAPYWKGEIQPEAFYVVHLPDAHMKSTHVEGGPYPTEERAFGDIASITDTSGT